MNIKLWNVCMLLGWLMLLAGGVVIHPGWGIAIAGAVLLVGTAVAGYVFGIVSPESTKPDAAAAAERG